MYARVDAVTCLPGVEVGEANGHTGFSVRGKRLAWLLVDHRDDGRLALCVKASPGEQETLVGQGGCYFVPAYLAARAGPASTWPRRLGGLRRSLDAR